MRVAFLVNDLQLSGGIGVVVHHARELSQRHGLDVTLVLVREQDQPHWAYEHLPHLHTRSLLEARQETFDVAVSTWWETVYSLFSLRAARYASFVQSLEDRFYFPDEPDRLGAAVTYDLPVAFITEAGWIADTLRELRPDATVHLVRNGIDKDIFAVPERVEPRVDGPLRVLVEGNPSVWFKHVRESITVAHQMTEPKHLTIVTQEPHELGHQVVADRILGPVTHEEMARLYAETDVVLKLSAVEGMYGPPLEGMHKGATCVTTEVTGHEEYVVHGWNALVCDWDDRRGTARQLDLLARDRRLLHLLRTNALETARAWPTWTQQGGFMALALEAIRREPPPPPGAGAQELLADVRAGVERYRLHIQERDIWRARARRAERVLNLPPLGQVWRRRHSRPAQVARKVLGRLRG